MRRVMGALLSTLVGGARPVRHATAPAAARYFVVGDVHGCLDELKQLLRDCEYDTRVDQVILVGDLFNKGVACVNLTCGSPYYNPHIQRPAIFPPSDGYPPPEDPLQGVARQISLARDVKSFFPEGTFVGSGYSYLQDYLPHVAQAVVREGWIDSVGLGRMVLSYPTLPGDCLTGKSVQRKQICRTFSDCTTGPRIGLTSGCYPLDDLYKKSSDHQVIKDYKAAQKNG